MLSNSMVTDEALHPASLSARLKAIATANITRRYFSCRRRSQTSSSDLQWENKWRTESQMRRSRSHSVLQQAVSSPLCLPVHQSIRSLQTVCTYSPLWSATGLWGLAFSYNPIFHTLVDRGQLLSGLLLYSLRGEL